MSKDCNVTLNQEAGSGDTGQVNAAYEKTMSVADAPTREGCSFGGSCDYARGVGFQYQDEAMDNKKSWDKPIDGELNAEWTGLFVANWIKGSQACGKSNLHVTGYSEAVGSEICFDANADSAGADWNSTNSILTVKYIGGTSTLDDLKNEINSQSYVDLNATVSEDGSNTVPPSYQLIP